MSSRSSRLLAIVCAPLGAVVNRAFARRFLKEGDPVGQRFADKGPGGTGDAHRQGQQVAAAQSAAPQQRAVDEKRRHGDAVAVADWTNYLKKGSALYNTGNSLLGSAYGPQTVDLIPKVPTNDYNVLSDVASTGFWSPYGP